MWPFRTGRPTAEAELPDELAAIGDQTPLQLSIVLADAGDADAGIGALAARHGTEVVVQARRDDVIDVATAFQPGSAAVLRPLHALRRAGVAVRDLQIHDLVTDLSDEALARVVGDWTTHRNQGPYRRRVERLSGADLLERCLATAMAADAAGAPDAAAWRFAVRCVAFTTPRSETRLLTEAASSDARRAEWLVNAAVDRVNLARMAGLTMDVPAASLAAVLAQRGYVAERAAHLAGLLPSPLAPEVASALRDLVPRGGEDAQAALRALIGAEPTPELRATVDAALAVNDPNVRAAGLEVLARHWTDDARPVWREFLASTSAPLRWTAESVLGESGGEEDLADAAAHLAKIIRSKPGVPSSPPRGNEIIGLLARHRDHPEARTALEDLRTRWPRLSDDLRSWLLGHHPWLAPADPMETQPEQGADEPPADEELTFPPPTIERADDGSWVLSFDDAAAHHPVRDRFEALAEQHLSIEVVDGDREWLSVRVRDVDPETLVHELWLRAGSA